MIYLEASRVTGPALFYSVLIFFLVEPGIYKWVPCECQSVRPVLFPEHNSKTLNIFQPNLLHILSKKLKLCYRHASVYSKIMTILKYICLCKR